MDVEKMDEVLARILVKAATDIFLEAVAPLVSAGMEINEDELKATTDAMLQRMQNAMHWLPMSPDAVFEDGGYMLYKDGELWIGRYCAEMLAFELNTEPKTFYFPNRFSHYARITEPK